MYVCAFDKAYDAYNKAKVLVVHGNGPQQTGGGSSISRNMPVAK